jgi:hypothetical protein
MSTGPKTVYPYVLIASSVMVKPNGKQENKRSEKE